MMLAISGLALAVCGALIAMCGAQLPSVVSDTVAAVASGLSWLRWLVVLAFAWAFTAARTESY